MAQDQKMDLSCDEFYFSALFCETQVDQATEFEVSDSKYAEALHFQEALMASLVMAQNSPATFASASSAVFSPASPITVREVPCPMILKTEAENLTTEVGESSQSFCEICAERKGNDQMFTIQSCTHSFCSDCICKHVTTKVQENIHVVTCPGLDCKGIVDVDSCRKIMPNHLIARWDEALCESLVLASEKFYCPYRDCSAMLVNDGEEVIKESECPICRRLFCAQCYVPWHSGVECEEFQRLNEDEREREDLMVRELAKEKHWRRCPHCKFYVERTEGCMHMTCRCGFQFCYACGANWSLIHNGCRTT